MPALSVGRPSRALAAALAATVALAFGGCGGDGDEETSAVTTSEQSVPQATAPDDSGPAGGAGNDGDEGGGDRGSPAAADGEASPAGGQVESTPPPVSDAPVEGSKEAAPGVPISKHGDSSIQTYGVEAGGEERAEVAATVQKFYDARAARNWALACEMLAAKPRAEYERLLKSEKSGVAACTETMAALSQQVPTSAFVEEAEIEEVLSFRTDDEYAFLIYTRPDGKVYATAVAQEDGWKIVSVGPAEIVP